MHDLLNDFTHCNKKWLAYLSRDDDIGGSDGGGGGGNAHVLSACLVELSNCAITSTRTCAVRCGVMSAFNRHSVYAVFMSVRLSCQSLHVWFFFISASFVLLDALSIYHLLSRGGNKSLWIQNNFGKWCEKHSQYFIVDILFGSANSVNRSSFYYFCCFYYRWFLGMFTRPRCLFINLMIKT